VKLGALDKEAYCKGLLDGVQDRDDRALLHNLSSATREIKNAQEERRDGKGLWAFAYWSGYIVGLMTIDDGDAHCRLRERFIEQTEVSLTQEFQAFKEEENDLG
jgi:hypothetical protein